MCKPTVSGPYRPLPTTTSKGGKAATAPPCTCAAPAPASVYDISATTTFAEPPKKQRILCFHGFGQNAKTMHHSTASLRNALAPHNVQLVFINAPFVTAANYNTCLPGTFLDNYNNEHTCWLDTSTNTARDNAYVDCYDHERSWVKQQHTMDLKYNGFGEMITYLRKAFQELGPFDGIMGFSQGAGVALVLSAMKELCPERFPGIENVKTCVLIGGCLPMSPALHDIANPPQPYKTPSLHVWGESDSVLLPEWSKKMTTRYVDPKVHVHGGSHVIPSDSAAVDAIFGFLLGNRKDPITSNT